jgi:hypothetical protein
MEVSYFLWGRHTYVALEIPEIKSFRSLQASRCIFCSEQDACSILAWYYLAYGNVSTRTTLLHIPTGVLSISAIQWCVSSGTFCTALQIGLPKAKAPCKFYYV